MMTLQLTRASRLALLLLLPGATQRNTVAADGPPTITNQPASVIVLQGDPATFRVGADGTAPLFYQWFRNGAALSLATNAAYTLPVTSAGDQGVVFTVRVSNALASVISDPAVLTVDPGILATQTVIRRKPRHCKLIRASMGNDGKKYLCGPVRLCGSCAESKGVRILCGRKGRLLHPRRESKPPQRSHSARAGPLRERGPG
jgi:hypothetical protein